MEVADEEVVLGDLLGRVGEGEMELGLVRIVADGVSVRRQHAHSSRVGVLELNEAVGGRFGGVVTIVDQFHVVDLYSHQAEGLADEVGSPLRFQCPHPKGAFGWAVLRRLLRLGLRSLCSSFVRAACCLLRVLILWELRLVGCSVRSIFLDLLLLRRGLAGGRHGMSDI